MLPLNDSGPGNHTFGCVITDTIDITAVNPSNPGTDEVMLWWDIAHFSTTEDIMSGFGATSNQNSPAVRSLQRLDPETSGIYVYASVDNGVSWYRCDYLEPIDLTTAGTDLRLAFMNTTDTKVYLIGFACLFPDLIP